MLPYIGEIAALITAICWSFSSQFNGTATRYVSVPTVTLLRIPYNFVLIGLVYVAVRPTGILNLEIIFYLLASAIFGVAICDTTFYKAVSILGPRLGCLVQSTSSCMTALLAYLFFGEIIGLYGALGIGIALFGVFFVMADGGNIAVMPSGGGRKELIRGTGIALISAITFALNLLCAKQAMLLGASPLGASLVRLCFGGAILLLFCCWRGWLGGIWGGFVNSRMAWKYMLIGGFFTALGIWMASEAMKYAEAGVAATIMALEPVLIIPINSVIEKRKPNARAIIGTIIAFCGITILIMR